MQKTVIMVVGRQPAYRDGGSSSYVRAAGRAAIRAGYEPHLFCVGPESRDEDTPYGVLHCVKAGFPPYRTVMVAALGRKLVPAIERFALSRGGRCLIHSFGAWGGVGAQAARRLSRRGIECATVVTPFTTALHEIRGKLDGVARAHGLWTRIELWVEVVWTRLTVSPSEGRSLRKADLVLVNYDSVRAIVEAEHGNGIRFRKSPYSSEAAFIRAECEDAAPPDALAGLEPKDAPLILSVSRHDARKGLDIFLRALARLRECGVAFRACLVGAGPLLEPHRRLAAELGLLGCTAIPGGVADAYACLKHADVFALPSLEEGSGSVALLEAMQAGAAAVVSRVDGLPEDVAHRESALLVRPGDTADLADALRLLLQDRELRARLARGARAVYRDRFSAEAFATELARTYAGLGFPPARPAENAEAELNHRVHRGY